MKRPALEQIRRVSNMERHDLKSESETIAGNLQAQLQRFQQLNEFCDQAVAEIRALRSRNTEQQLKRRTTQDGSP